MDEIIQDEQEVIEPVVDDTTENTEELNSEELLAQKKHWRDKAIKEAEARKKLEEELEALKKPVDKPTKEVQPTPDYITKEEYEEGILRTSKGYADDDISVLNVIAKGKGINLFQAEQDEMFKLHQAKKASEERKSKASLGASKGSAQSMVDKKPKTREEHEAMWREKQGL